MSSPLPPPVEFAPGLHVRGIRPPLRLAASLIAAASLAGCAPMPSGGSSSLPSLSRVFSEGLSFSPSVNVARNHNSARRDPKLMAEEIDGVQTPPRWDVRPLQQELVA